MELVKDTSAFDKEFLTSNPAPTMSSHSNIVGAFEHTASSVKPLIQEEAVSYTNTMTDMNLSLASIVQSIREGDDQPLREFLSILILQGGVNTTLDGVKALLAVYKNTI